MLRSKDEIRIDFIYPSIPDCCEASDMRRGAGREDRAVARFPEVRCLLGGLKPVGWRVLPATFLERPKCHPVPALPRLDNTEMREEIKAEYATKGLRWPP